MSMPPISSNGIWLTNDPSYYLFDAGLAAELCRYLSGQTVLDIGCGAGAYVKVLQAAGINTEGFDGNPHTSEMSGGVCGVCDFSKPVWLDKIYDFVLCLEVGEHIPAENEVSFLCNITSHAKKGIVLSWAIPGQGGYGHVNERSNEYIEHSMKHLRWVIDPFAKERLRQAATLRWLQKTLMVFVRPEYAMQIYPGQVHLVDAPEAA